MTCYSSHGMMSEFVGRMGTCDTSRGLMEKMAAKSNSTFGRDMRCVSERRRSLTVLFIICHCRGHDEAAVFNRHESS